MLSLHFGMPLLPVSLSCNFLSQLALDMNLFGLEPLMGLCKFRVQNVSKL